MPVDLIDDITAVKIGKGAIGAGYGAGTYLAVEGTAQGLGENPEVDEYDISSRGERIAQNVKFGVGADGIDNAYELAQDFSIDLGDDPYVLAGAMAGATAMREVYRKGKSVDNMVDNLYNEIRSRI